MGRRLTPTQRAQTVDAHAWRVRLAEEERKDALLEEARDYCVPCPSCKALMVPATTSLSWWDCINPYCNSGRQPE